jgi:hypothetical protein
MNCHLFVNILRNRACPIALELVSLFPIVPISPGDLLGIFPGKIGFSEHCNVAQSIMGPTPYLWLDYSQVTGPLNQMRVARPGGEAHDSARRGVFWKRLSDSTTVYTQYTLEIIQTIAHLPDLYSHVPINCIAIYRWPYRAWSARSFLSLISFKGLHCALPRKLLPAKVHCHANALMTKDPGSTGLYETMTLFRLSLVESQVCAKHR